MVRVSRVFPGIVIVFALAALLLGCVPDGTRPLVVINAPPSGSIVDTNVELLIQTTASDPTGIARIELWANNALVAAESNTTVGTQGIFSTVFRWTPRQPGTYILEAKAFSRTSEMSYPASISITARDSNLPVPITLTSTPLPTRTLTPSPTWTIPAAPSPTATLTPIPPSPTRTATPTVLPPTATPTPTNVPPTVPVPPSPPTGLSALVAGQTTANLSWTDNANDEDGFKVYRNLSGTDALVGTRAVNNGIGNTTFALTGLTCSEEYRLYVKSYRGTLESAASNSVTLITDPCSPTSVAALSHTGQTVTVNWTDTSTTPEETGFNIYFGTTLKKTVAAHAGTGAMSTAITGLDCGTTYSDIRVSAIYNTRESPKSSSAGSETTSNCQIKVAFTRVDIKDDTDRDTLPFITNSGEIRLTFNVEGQVKYWPSSSGSKSIKTGDQETFSVVFDATNVRSNALSLSVHAEDVEDDPDDMGTVTATYPGNLPSNFGAGANKTLENTFFKVYFTITVTSPP